MNEVTVRELRKNLSTILGNLPVKVINGRTKEVLAIIEFPEPMTEKEFKVVKQKINGNKAMQDFMAKNTMLKTSDTVNKSGKTCEVSFCRKDAVEQGVWVEYNETGTHKVQLWLCAEHLEKGKRNDQADY